MYVFDHETTFVGELGDPSDVINVFKDLAPRGSTDIAKALEVAMKYVCRKARNNFAVVPGTTFIVILDGSPNDKEVGENAVKKQVHAISQIQ
jgi:Mg-chelatase subunit ChlD